MTVAIKRAKDEKTATESYLWRRNGLSQGKILLRKSFTSEKRELVGYA